MPFAVFALWPALHLMYGVNQHRSDKIDQRRRYAGRILLAAAFLFASQPYGWEKGIFYLLFSLMACSVVFVQLRIWRPALVPAITVISIAGGLYALV
ncbi:MAG: DUF3325 family protein [Saccharospirillaceae bacterium]|jgi:hypothetical protein|nr:hypothetical protein A3759_15675 [Thalassolituus sp. HI0120]MCH2040056.1 DUF3325 family protein [Saccharospirillaceae bacterium]